MICCKPNLEIVVISAVRTPFGKFGGILKNIHSIDLAVLVMKEALKRANLPATEIDELYYGMCILSEAALESNVNARQAILRAGFPEDIPSLSIDRACCSSLAAVQLAMRAIICGEANCCMAVGTENMSNTPLLINGHRWGTGLQAPRFKDHLNPICYSNFNALAKDAGDVAIEHGIDRIEQDTWALVSQQRYQTAKKEGKFVDEIMEIEIPKKKGPPLRFKDDEFPKADTTLDGLSKLQTIYGSPTVTAGNSPGLDAGAAAIILMEKSKAEKLGIHSLGSVISVQSIAMAPRYMAEAPGHAIENILSKTGYSLNEMKLIEINEAFAAMPLVSTKVLSKGDEQRWRKLLEVTNVNGGAIAIGHPVGASGARILMTLIYELKRRGGGLGVASICGGLAQADAALIRV